MGCGSSSRQDPTATWAPFAQETYLLYHKLCRIRNMILRLDQSAVLMTGILATDLNNLEDETKIHIRSLQDQYHKRAYDPSNFLNKEDRVLSEASIRTLINEIEQSTDYFTHCHALGDTLLLWNAQGHLSNIPGFQRQLLDENLRLCDRTYHNQHELNLRRTAVKKIKEL